MQKEEFQEKIRTIMDEGSYTPSLYALLSSDGSYTLKRIRINVDLENLIKEVADNWLNAEIFGNEFELNDISRIEENRKVFYSFESYPSSIKFPALNASVAEYFSEEDQINLIGILVYINKDDECFWLYQHHYQMSRMNRAKSIFAFFDGVETYKPIESDIFRIDHKFDFIIIGDFLAVKNWKLLQQNFGFEKYVRSMATQYVDGLEQMDFISDITKLRECSDDFKFAKKIMKLKDSMVLQIEASELIHRIENHSYYATKLPIDPSTGKILVTTKKTVTELLKMLNDSVLHSELTDINYHATSKENLVEN
jgi:hypothetical protein